MIKLINVTFTNIGNFIQPITSEHITYAAQLARNYTPDQRIIYP